MDDDLKVAATFSYFRKYKSPVDLIRFRPRPVEDLVGDALVVLDTNVLLSPFNLERRSWAGIQEKLQILSDTGRLRIPKHALREFLENRAARLTEAYRKLKETDTTIKWIELPLLEGSEGYKAAKKAYEKAVKAAAAYKDSLKPLIDEVSSMRANDIVTTFLSDLPESTFFEFELREGSEQKLQAEWQERVAAGMAPGAKDARKPHNGGGDFLIWKSVLELGRLERRDVLFVTLDGKSDWWHSAGSKRLFTRFDLVSEYWSASNGCTLGLAPLSFLLNKLGVDETIVKDVKRAGTENPTLEIPQFSWIDVMETLSNVARANERELLVIQRAAERAGLLDMEPHVSLIETSMRRQLQNLLAHQHSPSPLEASEEKERDVDNDQEDEDSS